MSEIAYLDKGFEVDGLSLLDWTPRFTMTLERVESGEPVAVCWFGTFWVVSNESGGVMGEGDGVAVGLDASGKTWVDPRWEESFGDFPAPDASHRNAPLVMMVEFARTLAFIGTVMAQPVRREMLTGRDFDQVLAETEADPALGVRGELVSVAVGLVWCAWADWDEATAA